MTRKQRADLFAAARKRAGYNSQYAFCKATGFPKSTLGAIERGDTSPTVDMLERFAKAIGCRLDVRFVKENRGAKR